MDQQHEQLLELLGYARKHADSLDYDESVKTLTNAMKEVLISAGSPGDKTTTPLSETPITGLFRQAVQPGHKAVFNDAIEKARALADLMGETRISMLIGDAGAVKTAADRLADKAAAARLLQRADDGLAAHFGPRPSGPGR